MAESNKEPHVWRVRCVIIIVACSAALTCCSRIERPSEAIVQKLVVAGGLDRGGVHYARPPFKSIVAYGTPLKSTGKYGPEGTNVFPVRVLFSNSQYKVTYDVYFWLDPFGTWQAEAAP